MADEQQLKLEMLRRIIHEWNEWSQDNTEVKLNLTQADLSGVSLTGRISPGRSS